jgi:hypothetical protein
VPLEERNKVGTYFLVVADKSWSEEWYACNILLKEFDKTPTDQDIVEKFYLVHLLCCKRLHDARSTNVASFGLLANVRRSEEILQLGI